MTDMIIKDGIRYRIEDLPVSQTYEHIGPIGVAAPLEVPELSTQPEQETEQEPESDTENSEDKTSTKK